jgi:hypothetical protein
VAYDATPPVSVEPSPNDDALALAVHPNPLRDTGTVTFTLDRAQHSVVTVHDALGRPVAVLHDGPLGAGTHRLRWDPANALPAGGYVVRVRTEDRRVGAQRVVLVR